jgi:hypothetical protein
MPVIALIPFEIPFFMFILLLAWFVLGPGGLSAFQGQDARAPYTIRRFRRSASVLPEGGLISDSYASPPAAR